MPSEMAAAEARVRSRSINRPTEGQLDYGGLPTDRPGRPSTMVSINQSGSCRRATPHSQRHRSVRSSSRLHTRLTRPFLCDTFPMATELTFAGLTRRDCVIDLDVLSVFEEKRVAAIDSTRNCLSWNQVGGSNRHYFRVP